MVYHQTYNIMENEAESFNQTMGNSEGKIAGNQNKFAYLALILSGFGLSLFLIIASTFPFRDRLLDLLYPKPTGEAAEGVTLSLPSQITTGIGSIFEVPIMLDANGNTVIGVDVVINFDQSKLTLQDIIPKPENSALKTFAPIDASHNFDKRLVEANASGVIEFGAVAFDLAGGQPLSGFNGTLGQDNPLAVLQFEALGAGQTNVTFDFTEGSTTDSNMVSEDATDLLGDVQNLVLTVLGPTSTPTLEPTQEPTVSPTLPPASPTPTPVPSERPGPGDINDDSVVNVFDLGIFSGNYGKTGITTVSPVNERRSDMDGDGDVDVFDLGMFAGLYGTRYQY